MKQWISLLLTVLLLCTPAAALAQPSEEELSIGAPAAILIERETGTVLYEKNADEKRYPASTTKIMTALLICEQCNVLDRMRIPKEAVGIEGSSMYLQEGEVLTLQFDAGDALEAVRHSSPEYAANEKMQQIASVMQNYPGIMLGGQLNK